MALEKKTLLETKNRALKCLKRHYSTVQSMKNVAELTEDGVFGTPGNMLSKAQKNVNARGQPGWGEGPGGGGWAQLELTDALSSLMYSITVLCKTLSFCPLVILCFSEGFSPTEWVSSYSLEIEVGSSNNDNALFLFSCDILYYTSNQFSEKKMCSLFCVQTLFQRFLFRILISRSPFCQTSPLMLSSSISC